MLVSLSGVVLGENCARYYVNLWSGYLPMRTGRGTCTPTVFLPRRSKRRMPTIPSYPQNTNVHTCARLALSARVTLLHIRVTRVFLYSAFHHLTGLEPVRLLSYHQEDTILSRRTSQARVHSFVWWHMRESV